jgi:hypothetical protein
MPPPGADRLPISPSSFVTSKISFGWHSKAWQSLSIISKITGTVGILITAKQRGLVPAIRPFLDILRTFNFYISDSLYHHTLSAAKE